MNRYKFIFDTGDVYYENAMTKGRAIYNHCQTYDVPKEWVMNHCKIVNVGGEQDAQQRKAG